MSDSFYCDCLACGGYGKYKEQKCAVCDGSGVICTSHDSYDFMKDMSEDFCKFVDEGNSADDWEAW